MVLDRLTEADQDWVVRQVDGEIRRVAEQIGASNVDVKRVAEAMHCIVRECGSIDDPDGQYVPPPPADDQGMILVNQTRLPERRLRILRHELAHHLLTVWVPNALYGVDTVLTVEQDGRAVRHNIARRIESLALG